MRKRLIVGVSGASGAILGIELLNVLKKKLDWETHLVITPGGEMTVAQETKYSLEEVKDLADVVHPITNIGATIASGSFQVQGMVVIPCSMKTVSGIATGYSDNLLLRAADVTIKEQRKLVLVARESPLSQIHLNNMLILAQQGVTIMPPMVTYYNLPSNLDDINRHVVGKVLDKFGIPSESFRQEWEGM